MPARVRLITAGRRPPADAAGTHAVHAIRRHTDESHAAALVLVGELLAIGRTEQPVMVQTARHACTAQSQHSLPAGST